MKSPKFARDFEPVHPFRTAW